MRKVIIPAVLLLGLPVLLSGQNADSKAGQYDVFTKSVYFTDAPNALYHYLGDEACALLSARADSVRAIGTREGWEARQQYVRDVLNRTIGPFPERTPLNAKVTKVVPCSGYRVEQVIFESRPGFYVTGSLYVPDGARKRHKAPAILFCSGHAADGRLSQEYMNQMQNFARMGFVVLSFDPVGQGERIQYKPPMPPTREHSYPGTQMLVCGQTASHYLIWDGIRALDYLLSREEVDPKRVGVTGRSGGGTQTAMIAAMDDRLEAASPEDYITNYTRLLQTRGPQDAEQNVYQFIANGLDQGDFLLSFAPKPLMMITTTNDIFNIQGAMETEAEIKRAYRALGREEDFTRAEDYAGHQYTEKNMEANYAFFRKYLSHPGETAYVEPEVIALEDKYATPSGNVYDDLGGETLFSLNRQEAERLDRDLDRRRAEGMPYFRSVPAQARALSGYREPATPAPVLTGQVRQSGYRVDLYFTTGEGGYTFPYVIFRPGEPTGEYAVYLDERGKSDSSVIERIVPMVEKGITVLIPDLAGYGEMGPGKLRGDAWIDGMSHNLLYLSNLIGRSLAAIRAADVVSLCRLLRATEEVEKLTGFADGPMASVLLHAAAFSEDIDSVVLTGDLCSFFTLASNREYNTHAALNLVPGALKAYDLPDLAASLCPRPLSVVTSEEAGSARPERLRKEAQIIRTAYQQQGALPQFRICTTLSDCF